jgi:flagellar biosynthesis/type III secretory pathway M-ring protein FliF/YscJ
VILLLFVVRPLLRFLSEGPKPVTVQALAAAGGKRGGAVPASLSLDNLEREMETETEETMKEYKLEEKMPEETLKRESLKVRVIELINKEPETAANLVKSWMNEVE